MSRSWKRVVAIRHRNSVVLLARALLAVQYCWGHQVDRRRRQGLCYDDDDDDDRLFLLRVLCTRHHGGVVKCAYVKYADGMVKDEIGDKKSGE